MAYNQFRETQYASTLESSGTDKLLSAITTTEVIELDHVIYEMYFKGITPTNEKFRLNILSINGRTLFSSSWVTLSNIDNFSTEWIGRVRFDFNRELLRTSSTYNISIESSSYTRSGDTTYASVLINRGARASNPPVKVAGYI